jgi:hypothetical protein
MQARTSTLPSNLALFTLQNSPFFTASQPPTLLRVRKPREGGAPPNTHLGCGTDRSHARPGWCSQATGVPHLLIAETPCLSLQCSPTRLAASQGYRDAMPLRADAAIATGWDAERMRPEPSDQPNPPASGETTHSRYT